MTGSKAWKNVTVVESSGIASLCLPNGTTTHSAFKIPSNASSTPAPLLFVAILCRKLKITQLIIWDEALMYSRFVYESVDRSLRDIRKTIDPLTASFCYVIHRLLPAPTHSCGQRYLPIAHLFNTLASPPPA